MFSKKINVLFLAIIALVIFSCNPMEETYKELDSKLDKDAVSDVTATVQKELSSEDYTKIGDLFSKTADSLETRSIASYGNFNSKERAKKFIPALLKNQYGHLGNGSAVKTTYKVYEPIRSNGAAKAYTLVKEDYDAIGGNAKKYGNVNSQSDLFVFANNKYPSAKNGDSYDLTYKIYKGKVYEETATIIKLKNAWNVAMSLTSDQYSKLGASSKKGKDYFSSSTTAKRNIGIFMKELKPFAKADDEVLVKFGYSKNRGTTISQRFALFMFDGTNWQTIQDAINQTLQFGLEKNVWVPDNTIKFTLSATDFTFISKQEGIHTSGALKSAGNYKNFDRRVGNDNFWSDEKILAAVNALLKNNYSSAKEGQKFDITYAIYNGSPGTENIKVILKDGAYIKQ